MKIKVEENRRLIFLNKPGTQNENDVTTLEIEVPEKYEDYNKKIVFITADGVVWDIIENNTYILKKSITKYKSVEFYIWLTKGTEDFRSETRTLRPNKNVDPNGEMTEEEINGINKLLNEIEGLKKEIEDIEITGGGSISWNADSSFLEWEDQ